MSLSEERAARNEALFREVNEQIADIAATAPDGDAVGFACECSNADCNEPLLVPLSFYQQVRSHSRRFLVVPGHDNDFEHVIARHDGYAIVENEGTAGRLADRTDPRS
jgi:hypothetical protein